MSNTSISSPSLNEECVSHARLIRHYAELNTLWKQAEEALAAMRIVVPVEVKVKSCLGGNGSEPDWQETEFLGWRKLHKDWRICHGVITEHSNGKENSEVWKPVAEAPMESRVELAEHFSKLKAKMIEARQKYIPQIGAAVASLKKALAD